MFEQVNAPCTSREYRLQSWLRLLKKYGSFLRAWRLCLDKSSRGPRIIDSSTRDAHLLAGWSVGDSNHLCAKATTCARGKSFGMPARRSAARRMLQADLSCKLGGGSRWVPPFLNHSILQVDNSDGGPSLPPRHHHLCFNARRLGCTRISACRLLGHIWCDHCCVNMFGRFEIDWKPIIEAQCGCCLMVSQSLVHG